MYEASLNGVIETILIILLIYFGLKLIFRWLGPVLLKYILTRIGRKFEQRFQGFDPHAEKKEEGKVSIDKKPKKTREGKKDVGEYIDYEEIE